MAVPHSVYQTFLESSDLNTWRRCLHDYQELIKAQPLTIRELTDGICISIYVQWLASLYGEKKIQEESDNIFQEWTGLASKFKSHSDREELAMLKAVLAAGCGYHGWARKLLTDAEVEFPLEIALLTMPSPHAERAKLLKKYIFQKDRPTFLPVYYFYAHALLSLGYYEEVEQILQSMPKSRQDPLMIDLSGKLFELQGDWTRAYEAYRQSEWVAHKYRAAICNTIIAAAGPTPAEPMQQLPDEKVLAGMLIFDSEVDQAEVARSNAFVNACRWHSFDNWLVNYELGKLSFRRRRHAEAEKYLKLAAAQAPEVCLFAINNLRFINFTWLGGSTKVRDIPVDPETLECGIAALAAPGDEVLKAPIRTWMATTAKDPELVLPVFQLPAHHYDRSLAYEFFDNQPEALQAWCRTISHSFVARAYFQLIRFFAACNFEKTTSYLVEVVMKEAWDNFFVLWDLGMYLLDYQMPQADVAGINSRLSRQFAQLEKRIEELSQHDFQNLMRAFEFFSHDKRQDIADSLLTAESLLRRAGKLAESPEEYLSLVVARRKAGDRQNREGELLAMENLLKAEKESIDRLERLQIAREFFKYRNVQRARAILQQEGVPGQTQDFEAIEYILALECGQPCLSAEEWERLRSDAQTALERDLKSNVFLRYGHKFLDRLKDSTQKSMTDLFSLVDQRPPEEGKEDGESTWKSLKDSLEQVKDTDNLEAEKQLIQQKVLELENEPAALFYRYTLWEYIFKNLELILESVKSIRPNLDPEQVPISKSESIIYHNRARQWSKLWKEYLISDDPEEREAFLSKIRAFRAEETRLRENWEALRAQRMKKPALRAAYFARYARSLLLSIGNQERAEDPWPVFLDIQQYIFEDIELLTEKLNKQITTAGMSLAESG